MEPLVGLEFRWRRGAVNGVLVVLTPDVLECFCERVNCLTVCVGSGEIEQTLGVFMRCHRSVLVGSLLVRCVVQLDTT